MTRSIIHWPVYLIEKITRLFDVHFAMLKCIFHTRSCQKSFALSLQEEMETKRVEDEQDYWLIQYQRLLDKKPESLINQVSLK